MTDSQVRVRIAPSPSGYLHVGTARTAIFNYLFARHYGGKFLVRIEDTDAQRSDHSLIEPILKALKWLGLDWDEEIVYQSKRFDIYKEQAAKILASGDGYRCFCSPQKLEADRVEARAAKRPPRYNRRCLNLTKDEIEKRISDGEKFAVRLKIPPGKLTYTDMVLGEVTRSNDEIEDFIIARSDGSATYNLAVVIDDHDMKISHVIRGNDHVTNSFKQIHIGNSLGYGIPKFGHVPLILRPDKKKVSKRLGDKDIGEYRAEGILPEAMFNYLCLLGWSPKSETEIYSVDEFVKIFTEKNFNAANAIFNEDKLVAFNKVHIGRKSASELAVEVVPMLVEADLSTRDWLETRSEYLHRVIEALKGRVRRISEFVSLGGYFFSFDYQYDPEAAAKQFTAESGNQMEKLADQLEQLKQFDHDSIERTFGSLADKLQLKKARLIHPARLAVSGMSVGPGLYELLEILGQETVVERLRKAAGMILTRTTG